MKSKILVTGGAGYVGSVLVPMLLEEGHEVTVLDNFMFGQNPLSHVCHHPRFQVVRGDVRNEPLVAGLAKKADVIMPLAARVGAPLCDRDPWAATSTNRDSILAMLKHLSNDQRVIVPNTNSGYGTGKPGQMCTEDSPMSPLSLYAKDKVEMEAGVLARKNSVSLRLATVFGMSPRMRVDLLVNDFVHRAVFDRFVVLFEGHFKRNYIHIRDVARAFLHVLDRFDGMRGEAYNVGLSDANLSKSELCETIRGHLPSFVFLEAPVGEDPDKRDYIVSNEKIEKTGFLPQVSLDDGIRELIKGYTMIKNTRFGNV